VLHLEFSLNFDPLNFPRAHIIIVANIRARGCRVRVNRRDVHLCL
jgi:hypothetical protein